MSIDGARLGCSHLGPSRGFGPMGAGAGINAGLPSSPVWKMRLAVTDIGTRLVGVFKVTWLFLAARDAGKETRCLFPWEG